MRSAGQPLLVMTRVIAAKRDAVFAEWNNPQRLARWWDPDGSRLARPGRYTVAICSVQPPERIVFTWGGDGAETTTLITITLVDDGPHTRLTLEQAIARSPCWASALERLRDVLSAEPTGAAS